MQSFFMDKEVLRFLVDLMDTHLELDFSLNFAPSERGGGGSIRQGYCRSDR